MSYNDLLRLYYILAFSTGVVSAKAESSRSNADCFYFYYFCFCNCCLLSGVLDFLISLFGEGDNDAGVAYFLENGEGLFCIVFLLLFCTYDCFGLWLGLI